MNTYRIKTTTITFEVNAEDSDMATVAAEEWIKRRGIPIESQRAELHLLDGKESMNLGSFHLAGEAQAVVYEYPATSQINEQ